jgi:hypothetical protein
MSRRGKSKRSQAGVPDHPAVRAWGQLRPGAEPAGVELLHGEEETKKRTVYRLEGAGPDGSAVIAKRCPSEPARVERTLYEEVLPQLPVPTLTYHGLVEEPGGTFCWLFLEDAGGEPYSPRNEEHRALAARWLAALHTSAARLAAAARLPDRGPAHYLRHLLAARATILANSGHRALTADDRAALGSIVSQYDALAARWGEVEKLCDGLPRTLVHGDFVKKNLRVRADRGRAVLLPFDWGETAGWGVPAADVGSPAKPDLAAYEAAVREHWPGVDTRAVQRLANLGRMFRYLAAVEWAARGLPYPCPEESRTKLRLYASRLADVIAAGCGDEPARAGRQREGARS